MISKSTKQIHHIRRGIHGFYYYEAQYPAMVRQQSSELCLELGKISLSRTPLIMVDN